MWKWRPHVSTSYCLVPVVRAFYYFPASVLPFYFTFILQSVSLSTFSQGLPFLQSLVLLCPCTFSIPLSAFTQELSFTFAQHLSFIQSLGLVSVIALFQFHSRLSLMNLVSLLLLIHSTLLVHFHHSKALGFNLETFASNPLCPLALSFDLALFLVIIRSVPTCSYARTRLSLFPLFVSHTFSSDLVSIQVLFVCHSLSTLTRHSHTTLPFLCLLINFLCPPVP